MKYTVTSIILLFVALSSCNLFTKTIELDTYVLLHSSKKLVGKEIFSPEGNILQIVDTISESEIKGYAFLPKKGLRITIDTINNTIYIPLSTIEDRYFATSLIDRQTIPFVDNNSGEINLSISSWKQTDKEGLVLNTQYNGTNFRCTIIDSLFSIGMENGDKYLFIGGEKAKESSKDVYNPAKQDIYPPSL